MKHFQQFQPVRAWGKALILLLLVCLSTFLFAEGSKDFISYPGYRMFLDNRSPQQLKVYAGLGEFINVGASHLGFSNAFIKVYRPNGTLAVTFDGTGASAGKATIINNVQEANGPTGGGTTNGAGYVPGVVQVAAGEAGIWTVHIGYPTYLQAQFTNILNNAPWNRAANQPTNPSVVLAWDITVSTNAAGNMGGSMKEGRVFTNEYISVINQNGYVTSPTFYVLTINGFLYQVDFMDADPFRFPISSSSMGMVNGDLTSSYTSHERDSVIRSDEPGAWSPGKVYQYEPQAQDYLPGNLFNNKIFFNEPDPAMPTSALTTDIFRGNTHTAWLFNPAPAPVVTLNGFQLEGVNTGGLPCFSGSIETGMGAWFQFNSSHTGTATLSLDLNNDGDFADAVDRRLSKNIIPGIDSIFWDGKNGLGTVIPASTGFAMRYRLSLKNGETHITLSDIENNLGGVTFKLLSNVPVTSDKDFYYDHSTVAGPVSGGGSPGHPLATNQPFVYQNNFGNNKMLDYWAFVEYAGALGGTLVVNIVDDCRKIDADGDGISDYIDLDDDNDGVPDLKEYCNASSGGFACLPGGLDPSKDADNDGILNYQDASDPAISLSCTDANNDGICDQTTAMYDTDGDNVPDHLDLDSDNDGITDLTEAGHNQPDANSDGVIDGQAAIFGLNGLYNPIATDPNSPTATITYQRSDVDHDNVPDYDDLDSDNDGINDVAEAGYAAHDANNDGRLDDLNLVNDNGVHAIIDPAITGHPIASPPNTDDDSYADFRDLDSDGDGVFDVMETNLLDPDFDGILGFSTPIIDTNGRAVTDPSGNALATLSKTTDTDGDQIPDYQEVDADADDIADSDECGAFPCANGDGDAKPDFQDWDRDNDGIADSYECENSVPCTDTDNDGTPDVDDMDTDGDGLTDIQECGGGAPCPDSNNNGVPNWREYTCHAGTPVAILQNVTAPFTGCEGENLTLSATNSVALQGQVTYTWSGPNGFSYSGTANPQGSFPLTLNDLQAAASGNYSLVVYTAQGCPSAAAQVSVNVGGATSTPQLVLSDNTPCQGGTLQLTTPSVGTSYEWFYGNGVGTITLGVTTVPTYFIYNVNPAHNGLYSVAVAGGACGSGVSLEETVTVNSTYTQAPPIYLSNDVLCEGSNLTLSSNPVQGANPTWFWYFQNGGPSQLLGTSVVPSFGVNNVSLSNTGTYTVVVNADGCQSPASNGEYLLVGDQLNSQPMLVLSDNQLCAGENLVLTSTAYPGMNVTYQWLFNGMAGPTTLGTTNVPELVLTHVMPISTGNYLVVAGVTGCASVISPIVQATVFPAINQVPVLTAATSTLCVGGDIELSATAYSGNGVTYEWFFGNTLAATTTDPVFSLENANMVNTGSWSVRYIQNGCTSQMSASQQVTVTNMLDAFPVLTVSEHQICQGGSLVLTSSPVNGQPKYEWLYDGGTGFTMIASTTTPTLVLNNLEIANSGNYAVQVRIGNCTSPITNSEAVTVSNMLAFTPTINVSAPVLCSGESLILSSSTYPGNVQYEWFFSSGAGQVSLGTSSLPTLTVPYLTTSNSGFYTVVITSGNCASPAAIAQNVAVSNSIMNAPTLSISGDVLCVGSTFELNSSIVTGTAPSYEWFFNNGTTNVSLGVTNIPTLFIQNITSAQTGIYTVVASNGNCTSPPSNAQDLTVSNDIGPAPVLTLNDYILCEGELLELNSSVFSGTNAQYEWYFNDGSSTISLGVSSVPTLFVQNVGAANTGTYSVAITSGNCTTQMSNLQNLTVTNILNGTPTLSASDATLCAGEKLTLTSSPISGSGTQYEWFFDNGNGAVLVATTDVPTYFINDLTASNTGNYSVVATNGNCDSPSSNLVPVTVVAMPSLTASNLTDADHPACPGDVVHLSITALPGATYAWNGPLGFAANTANAAILDIDAQKAGDYVANVQLQGCSFTTAPTTVFVYDNVEAQDDVFDVKFNKMLENIDLVLNDQPGNVGNVTVRIVEPAKHGEATENGLMVDYMPNQNFFGEDQFTYEVCNEYCPDDCDRATVTLRVAGTDDTKNCFVPNIITPNGDGKNDFFTVPCLKDAYPDNNVKIFNRWGDEVFTAKPYRNDWDGKYKGNALPPGTYYYLIQLAPNLADECLQGYFTITR